MARRSALRASDSDRERVADRLREATGEGRLLAEELEDRLGRALRARTYGELDALVADLPRPRERPQRNIPFWARGVIALVALVGVLALAALAAFVIAGVLATWVVWVAIGWMCFGRARVWDWHCRAGRWGREVRAGRWDESQGPTRWVRRLDSSRPSSRPPRRGSASL
jgi:Domain of unknown function (DUF1707)